MQAYPLRKTLLRNIFAFASNRLGGNLYTWGHISLGSGIDQVSQIDQLVPRRVQEFNGNVAKVATGKFSTAVITTDGDLYTFGRNNKGQLGQGTRGDQLTPSLVESFREKGLKVIDVVMGIEHGAAITSDGSVWAWGHNGVSKMPFWNRYFPAVSGLGVNAEEDILTPTRVDIKGQARPQSISAGYGFTLLHDEKNQLWGWGQGTDGQLGNGYEDHMHYPQFNDLWSDMQKDMGLKILKIKSAQGGTIALLDNGQLIGWGGSFNGQLGVREQEFVRSDAKNPVPMDVNKRYMRKSEKVIDFDLSADVLIYYTNENNVYYSGNGRYFIPNLFHKGGDNKVVKVVAAKNSFAFIKENGDMYASNDFIEPIEWRKDVDVARIPKEEIFDGGKILDMGGTYDVRYAIVQN